MAPSRTASASRIRSRVEGGSGSPLGGGKRVAAAEEFAGANGVFDEVELNAGEQGFDGAEDLDAFGHDFGADSIAAEDCDLKQG